MKENQALDKVQHKDQFGLLRNLHLFVKARIIWNIYWE